MKRKPALTAEEIRTVRTILRAHLPVGAEAAIFGSRATGSCKPWSDLDLAITSDAPLSLSLIAALSEAFSESDLPWKVDIVDRKTVSAEFGRIMDETGIPFELV